MKNIPIFVVGIFFLGLPSVVTVYLLYCMVDGAARLMYRLYRRFTESQVERRHFVVIDSSGSW